MTPARPRTTGHPGYNLTRDRVPKAAEEARRLARLALATWGLDEYADTATLLLSELVTNAVRHAHGRSVRIIVDRPADERLYLAVVDPCASRLPVTRTPGDDDISGRGLLLVKAFAVRWGCDLMGTYRRAPRGKRVWLELAVKTNQEGHNASDPRHGPLPDHRSTASPRRGRRGIQTQ